jgi:hypothetical protein
VRLSLQEVENRSNVVTCGTTGVCERTYAKDVYVRRCLSALP